MSVLQATIGGRFAPLAMLVDEDADLDSMVTHFIKTVTDTAAELLGKQRRKRKASQKEPKTIKRLKMANRHGYKVNARK